MVSGNGTGYAPPNATIEQYGIFKTVAVPDTAFIDAGSQYSFQNPLQGSSSTERWFTGAPQGNVTSSSFIAPTYSQQYALAASYTVLDGGTPGAPSLTGTSLGGVLTVPLTPMPGTIWLDAGSAYSAPNLLPPINSTERWYSISTLDGSMNGSSTFSPTYYHQYLVSYGYSIEGGGTPAPPVLNGTSFGAPVSFPFTLAPSSGWLDSGTGYSFGSLLSASTTERWILNLSDNVGIVTAASVLSPVFTHQFYLQVESDSPAGGSMTPASAWFDSGETVPITATANQGWQFEYWNGTGGSSFNGTLGSVQVMMNSPVVEYAAFYPGLKVGTTNYGTVTVTYNSSGSAVSDGSVPGNATEVIYVPLGANVSLTASPSLYVFQFSQWSGDVNSTAPQLQLLASSPMTLTASFVINWINTGITIAAIAAGLILLTWWIARRRSAQVRAKAEPPDQASLPLYISGVKAPSVYGQKEKVVAPRPGFEPGSQAFSGVGL